jgi:hypothetical protein
LALGDPYAGVYQIFANINPQEHIAYRDFSAIIWDCWFDPAAVGHRNPWSKQQINVGRGNPPSGSRPLTEAPAAVLGPVVWNSDTQQHFTFLGDSGKLWDAWYDWRTNGWSSRQINLGAAGGETTPANAPEAAGVPYVCSWGADDLPPTQHIVYRDLNGGIRDLWLDVVNDTWHADLLNMGGVFGNVPPAAGDPFVWTYSDQYLTDIHFTYRDANGTVWDMGYFMALPIEGRG